MILILIILLNIDLVNNDEQWLDNGWESFTASTAPQPSTPPLPPTPSNSISTTTTGATSVSGTANTHNIPTTSTTVRYIDTGVIKIEKEKENVV
jgi:hypothetical protein